MDLFPALPEELGLECLVRVPYTSHNNLAAVCRSWEAEVKNPQFYQHRKNIGVSQQCICLMELRRYGGGDVNHEFDFVITVYDPQQGTWETLPRLPHFPGDHHGIPHHCHCVCANRKLVLLGGWNPNSGELLHTVFIYDFSSARWSRGADIPPVGEFFACSVSPEGFIYVAGGTNNYGEAVRAAAVYNVEEGEWKLLPDMNRRRGNCFGALIDGKFFVFGGYSDEQNSFYEQNAEVYDPKTGSWTTLQNMWTVPGGEDRLSFGCTVGSSDGRFYFVQKEQGVMEYDSNENVWSAVGSLPQTIGTVRCCAAWRDMIFVSISFFKEGSGFWVLGNVKYDNVFYMLKRPMLKTPPIGCAAAVTQEKFLGEWVAVPIPKPPQSRVDYDQIILSAVTVEI